MNHSPTRRYLLCVTLFVLHAFHTVAWSVEAPESSRTNQVALALEAWDEHLVIPGADPATHEWKLRARLKQDPLDTVALDGLVQHFYAHRDFALSVATAQYAVRTGQTNFTMAVTNYNSGVHQVLQLDADGQAEGDAFTATRLDLLREKLAAVQKRPLLLDEFRELESGLRSLLADTSLQRDSLVTLAHYYHHRQDGPMTAMVSMLALRFDPSNQEMLDRCLEVLSKPAYERMQLEMIRFYASREDLSLSLMQGLIATGRKFDEPEMMHNLYVQTARLDPKNPKAWQDLGENLYALREYAEAMQVLTHAVTLPEHDFSIYYSLALIGAKKNDVPDMAFWLQRWRSHVDEDQLLAVLLKHPFRRYPRLLKELE